MMRLFVAYSMVVMELGKELKCVNVKKKVQVLLISLFPKALYFFFSNIAECKGNSIKLCLLIYRGKEIFH